MPITAHWLGEVRLRGVTEDDFRSSSSTSGTAWRTGWPPSRRGSATPSVSERPTYAGVAETNAASIRVLEKCGFEAVETNEEEHAGEILLRLG